MWEERTCFVYIMASQRNGTLYIGVTNNLVRRASEHKKREGKGFTAKYGVTMLVYYECFETPMGAIWREKQLKRWHRKWKLSLIEKRNPRWQELYIAPSTIVPLLSTNVIPTSKLSSWPLHEPGCEATSGEC